MKTNLLFVTALFFTGTAMSQAVTSNNHASSRVTATASSAENVSASSALSSSTTACAIADASSKTEAATRTTSEIKESGENRVEAANGEIKQDYQKVKSEVEADRRASVGVEAGSTAKIETEHNKAVANASINTGAEVSIRSTLESGVNTLETTVASTKKTVNASVNSINTLKSKAGGQANASVRAGNSAKVKAANAALKPRITGNISSRSAITIR